LNDPFALLGLPVRYALDRTALESAYRQVQSIVHPDRFATSSDRDLRVAVQWAAATNEAVRVLRDPVKRAALLCERHGHPVDAESNTSMPATFLIQQMSWREALDDARDSGDPVALEALRRSLDSARAALSQRVERAIDHQQNWSEAVAAVREWMFVERFADAVEAAEFALG
jgi:molecular chaperone HscB